MSSLPGGWKQLLPARDTGKSHSEAGSLGAGGRGPGEDDQEEGRQVVGAGEGWSW